MSEFLYERLLKTGWQSWSWDGPDKLIKFPRCNYPPAKIDVTKLPLPPVSENIKLKPPVKGWCSWYAFGQNINEQTITDQCKALISHNLRAYNHILLDDGWQSEWGDWLEADSNKFPSGLKAMAQKIREMGFVPGVWLAPFLVNPKAALVQQRSDWFVKKGGSFVDGMRLTSFDSHFSYTKYILDITNPEVDAYLDHVTDFLLGECGFKLIKLDFLYGIYFIPDISINAADSYLRTFLLKLKNKYPDVYTIGCGCPLIPAIGAVDSMRIGPDINMPRLQKRFIKYFANRFFYKRVMRTVKARLWTKELWNIDPDTFLFGADWSLSDAEINDFSQLIKMTGGNVFLADDMIKISRDRVEKFIDF